MFIDAEWSWQKVIIACMPFKEQQTGENLKEFLKKETDALELGDAIIKVFVTLPKTYLLAG